MLGAASCAVQEGSVDEVSFIAPELGPLAAIMVAPEGGSWVCDEVDVYSSRSNHTDRLVGASCCWCATAGLQPAFVQPTACQHSQEDASTGDCRAERAGPLALLHPVVGCVG